MTIDIPQAVGDFQHIESDGNGAPFDFVFDKPANIANDDYLTVWLSLSVTGTDVELSVSKPTGWEVNYEDITPNSSEVRGASYRKKITDAPNEPATYTFSVTLVAGTNLHRKQGWLNRVTGADLTTFLDVAVPSGTTSGVSSPSTPSITPFTDNAAVVSHIGAKNRESLLSPGEDAGFPTDFTGIALRISGDTSTSAAIGLAYRLITPAASTGTIDWNFTFSSGVDLFGRTMAIRPAAEGTELSPSSGSLELVGQPPTTLLNHIKSTQLTTLTIIGQGPDSNVGFTFTPDMASLSLSGSAPQALVGIVTVTGSTATLTLSGKVPSALVNHIAEVASAGLTLTGKQLSQVGPISLVIPSTDLLIDGKQVNSPVSANKTFSIAVNNTSIKGNTVNIKGWREPSKSDAVWTIQDEQT